MKKVTFSIILLIIILLPLQAQKQIDALYLKNGSIIHCKIIEATAESYKVQAQDGSVFIYPVSDVEKFERISSSFEGRKQNGMGFALEAGLMVGAQTTSYIAPFSFNLVINYTIDPKNAVGAGSGVEFLGAPFMPAFFEYRHIFNNKKVSPFIFARGGKMINLGDEGDNETQNYYYKTNFEGGGMFTLGTGISWSKEDVETYLSFAYRYARTSYEQKEYNNNMVTYTNNYNRLEIKFGFKF